MPPRLFLTSVIRRALHTSRQLKRNFPRTFTQTTTARMHETAMDESTLKQYLADDPPTIVPLAIKPHFDALDAKQKKYAHYISRAALAGTRINLRQVSAESEAIYDFIIELHKSSNGRWQQNKAQHSWTMNTNIFYKATGSRCNPRLVSRTTTSSISSTTPLSSSAMPVTTVPSETAKSSLAFPARALLSSQRPARLLRSCTPLSKMTSTSPASLACTSVTQTKATFPLTTRTLQTSRPRRSLSLLTSSRRRVSSQRTRVCARRLLVILKFSSPLLSPTQLSVMSRTLSGRSQPL